LDNIYEIIYTGKPSKALRLFSGPARTTLSQMKTATVARNLALPALLALALGACGTFEFALAPEAEGEEYPKAELSAEESYADRMEAPAPAPAAAGAQSRAAGTAGATGDPGAAALTQPEREKRVRIYSGWCRLVVDEVEQARKDLERLAVASGGYVEAVNGPAVSLRVPAARFQEVFAAVLKLGEVTGKAVETYDVSDTLRDQETRLSLSERARERLYQLLERTSDVQERLAILREIRRLTEEIEQVRVSLELLKNQIALSRITVELQARRPEGEARQAGIPFPWIAALQPLYPSLPKSAGKAVPKLSDDFAVFAKEKRFRAESPEGTRVRIGTTGNVPRGDEGFWQKALLFHLGPRFRSAEALEQGAFRGVLFTSKDAKPYSYLVAVRVKGELLYVFEAFFPDPDALDLRLGTVQEALGGLQ
jgi:hypothetical protein